MKINTTKLIIFTFVITLLSMYLLDDIVKGMFVAMFIVVFLYIVPISIFNMKKMQKWLEILFDDCDPYTFIEQGKELMDQKTSNKVIIQINLSVGLLEAGEYEQAKALLLSVDLDAPEFKQPWNRLAYYCNLQMSYLHQKQYDEAERIFKTEVEPLRFKRKIFIKNKQQLEAFYYFYQGEIEKSRPVLETYKPTSVIDRLGKLYCLAQFDLNDGKVDQAKEKLMEVVEKGNLLHVVQRAKEQLALLD